MMKQYETKKIDAIWLNSIPSHWISLKFKKLFDEINIKNYPQLQLLVASQNMGVVPKNIYGKRTVEAQKDLDKLKLVMPDNFVISLRSFQGGIEYSTHKGIISPAYTILKQKLDNNSLFFKYLFKSFSFIQLLQLCVTGIREGQNIDYDTLKEYIIPIPPREEQDNIVAYLDYQVSNINKLILSKRKQITLLEEYKKTKISEVVTKGLNPNVEMKDSGIDWIGQIPKHWEIKKLKDKFNFAKGLSITKEDLNDSGEKVINYGQIHSKNNKSTYITDELIKYTNKVNNSSKTSLGDFIFADTSEDFNGCGNFIYIDKNINLYAGYHTIILKSKYNNHNKFLAYLFLSNIWKQQIILNVSGIKVYSITQKILKNSNILLPPLNEQKEIADYLDNLTLKLDNIIDKHKLYIKKLEEYKKTLISDVVTGKIDVRDITIPKYEKVEIVDNIENNANIDELNME